MASYERSMKPTTGPGPQRIPKMPRPMPMEPMPMEPTYGDDFRSIPISKEEYLRDRRIKDQSGEGGNTGPMAPQPMPYEPMPKRSMPPGFTAPDGPATMAMVPFYNPDTGESWTASSGGYTPGPGWVRGTKKDFENNEDLFFENPEKPRSYGDDFRSIPISEEEYFKDKQIRDLFPSEPKNGGINPNDMFTPRPDGSRRDERQPPRSYKLPPQLGGMDLPDERQPLRPRMPSGDLYPDEGRDRSDAMRRIMEMFDKGEGQKPRRPRMPYEGRDEGRSDMMRRIMEMFGQGGDQRPPRRGPSRQDRRKNDRIYDMPRMPQRFEDMPRRPMSLDIQDIFTGETEYGAPMMMSNGGSAQNYGVDRAGNPLTEDAYNWIISRGGEDTNNDGRINSTELEAYHAAYAAAQAAAVPINEQALADGADADGDGTVSDEELYKWRPSDGRYGRNPNNRVNRNQAYSQSALDTIKGQGGVIGDDGVFSEDEFWEYDKLRQIRDGENYGGATLEGEFNYQDPSTWNTPPSMPERMPPMPPSQTTYVPEPAPNPYVFGGYGSPPPKYAGMADPRMTNIVGMAPPSYYGGAEEQLNGFS